MRNFFKKLGKSWAIGVVVAAWALTVHAQNAVFLDTGEALKFIFRDSQEVHKQDFLASPEVQKKVLELTGYRLPRNSYSFYIGKSGGKVDGYALIDEEVGKVLPITFITRINPQGRVEAVEIMVYRESRGGEVQDKRFLKQFHGKTLNHELRLHGDIINVSGATLSSRALVVGVKRALALWQVFYGEAETLPTKPDP